MKKESIFVLARTATDELGDPIPATDPDREIKGCKIIPRSSTSDAERGDVPISGFDIYAPKGTRVDAMDQIRVRGVVQEVEGTPADYGKKVRIATRLAGVVRVDDA